ncbi:hypothetical protein NDN08_002270 [Rhodosorus marinus]|uniref:Ribosomal RNA-processing protein 12-like conserved domain-containing protein n=1 Tax=Rhodosorus marinus TaxID=101924 RepID=A0AAV8UT86_9RHOD|nr:hypothetical protein NDN08_002270 [Rhodosorus marinus]
MASYSGAVEDLRGSLPILKRSSAGLPDAPEIGKELVPEFLGSEHLGGKKCSLERRERLKEALEVVRECVASSGFNDYSATAYMVATVLTLEELLKKAKNSNVGADKVLDMVSDMGHILSLTVQEARTTVIRMKWKAILSIATRALHLASEDELFCRGFCSITASIISVVDSMSWKSPQIIGAYRQLLLFGIDQRSRVQHRAKTALTAVYNGPRAENISIRLSRSNAAFLITALTDSQYNPISTISLAYVIGMGLNRKDTYKVALAVINLAKSSQPAVSAALLEYIPTLILNVEFVAGEADQEVTSSLSEEEALEVAKMLTSFPVSKVEDAEGVSACVAAFSASASALYSVSGSSADYTAKFCSLSIEMLKTLADPSSEIQRIASAMEQLVSLQAGHRSSEVLSALEGLLSYQFQPYWQHILQPLALMYQSQVYLDDIPFDDFTRSISIVVEKYGQLTDEDLQGPLENLIISLLRGGGAEIALTAAQFEFNHDTRVNNSWLMPLICNHLRGGKLRTFANRVLPIHKTLMERAKSEEQEGSPVASKNTTIVAMQVWSSLCGFCNDPTDLYEQIMGVGSLIAPNLNAEDPTMKHFAIKALRNLAQSAGNSLASEKDKKTYAKFLKNILPSLLKGTQTSSVQKREEHLVCITACLAASHSDAAIASNFLKRALKNVLEYSSGNVHSSDSARSSLDIAMAIVKSYALEKDSSELLLFYKTLLPHLKDPSDTSIQKKAYKALAQFLQLELISVPDDLVTQLEEAADSTGVGSKASRLFCIQILLEKLLVESLHESTCRFIVEIILYSRDASMKTRDHANKALLTVARRFYNVFPAADYSEEQFAGSGIETFLNLLCAGLAARNDAMIAATLMVIARVIYEFRAEIRLDESLGKRVTALFADTESMPIQPGPVTLLLQGESREVIRASVGVIKVATVVLDEEQLTSISGSVIPSLIIVADDSKKDLRLRVRVIVERMLRKCSLEVMERAFPVEQMKFLNNIRKQQARKAKRKKKPDSGISGFDQALGGSEDEGEVAESDLQTKNDRQTMKSRAMTTKTGRSTTAASLLSRAPTRLSFATDFLDGRNREVKDIGSRLRLKDDGDLLAENAASLVSKKDLMKRKRKSDDVLDGEPDSDTGGYIVGDDGRPIFRESESESEKADAGSDEDDMDRAAPAQSQRTAGGGRQNARKRGPNSLKGLNLGEEFKSRRGRGDVKRKSRPDPYAYVPLAPGAFASEGGGKRNGSAIAKVHLGTRRMQKRQRKA